jgi:hypothetical protein
MRLVGGFQVTAIYDVNYVDVGVMSDQYCTGASAAWLCGCISAWQLLALSRLWAFWLNQVELPSTLFDIEALYTLLHELIVSLPPVIQFHPDSFCVSIHLRVW